MNFPVFFCFSSPVDRSRDVPTAECVSLDLGQGSDSRGDINWDRDKPKNRGPIIVM